MNDNPNMSEVFAHMRVARRPRRKSRPRKEPAVKKEPGFFDQLRPTRAQQRESLEEARIEALHARFMKEMRAAGRDDLVDDESGEVFQMWLNENGLVEEDRAARFTGRTVKRACADPIKNRYDKFRYEHTGTAKRARQLDYIEAARARDLERRAADHRGDPDA